MNRNASPHYWGVFDLWETIYGPLSGYLGLFSALRSQPQGRTAHEHPGRLARHRQRFFPYPSEAVNAARWCRQTSEAGRETFYCVHLLKRRRRLKRCAAPVMALWAESDGGEDLAAAPEPSAIVESSPGHTHLFWRLMRPLDGERAEALNRRLAHAIGADPSGWDLSQMSRPPGTRNLKYPDAPFVRLLFLDRGILYHPRELELALPGLPPPPQRSDPEAPLPGAPVAVDLARLSGRMRRLAREGNDGAYASRSEADFAVCLAMFGAGYEEAEVWAVMRDPANGISERSLKKGRHAESYLALTIGKARTIVLGSRSA